MYHNYHHSNMPNYKLTYFDARGRAETIRFILAAAGAKYEDHRLKGESWPEIKPTMPFGTVPILEVNGKVIPQSNTICRFLAKEMGLAGKNAFEQALVDGMADVITDIREKGIDVMFEKDDAAKEERMKNFKEKICAVTLANIDKLFTENENGEGWLVGKAMSWADLHFYTSCDLAKRLDPDVLKDFPKLEALYQRVAEQEKIAEHLNNRPDTQL